MGDCSKCCGNYKPKKKIEFEVNCIVKGFGGMFCRVMNQRCVVTGIGESTVSLARTLNDEQSDDCVCITNKKNIKDIISAAPEFDVIEMAEDIEWVIRGTHASTGWQEKGPCKMILIKGDDYEK